MNRSLKRMAGTLVAVMSIAVSVEISNAQVFPVYDPGFAGELVDASSSETIPPGTKITTQNWQQYRRFMPLGLQKLYSGQYFWHVGNEPDFTVTVGPTIHTPLPKKYVEDTEKYHGQVKLRGLADGTFVMDGYVAGMPFPNPTEPNLAYKVAYNIRTRYGPWAMHIHYRSVNIDQYHSVTTSDGLEDAWRMGHISDPGMPLAQPYAGDIFYSNRNFEVAPEQVKYLTEITLLHDDPAQIQEIYLFLPTLRRSLRLSGAARCSPLLGTDWIQDDQGDILFLKLTDFRFRLLGEKKLLAMVHQDPVARNYPDESFTSYQSSLPGWPRPADGNWELRDMYVIEIKALPQHYCVPTRVIYVDKETFIPFLHDIYDPNNKLWKTYFFLQGIVPINPQEKAYLHDAFNDSIYDLQNKHMSLAQVAMPGVSANQYTPEMTRTQESTLAFPASLAQVMQ